MAAYKIVTVELGTGETQSVATGVRLITDAICMAEALSNLIRVGTDVVVTGHTDDYRFPGKAVFGNTK